MRSVWATYDSQIIAANHGHERGVTWRAPISRGVSTAKIPVMTARAMPAAAAGRPIARQDGVSVGTIR